MLRNDVHFPAIFDVEDFLAHGAGIGLAAAMLGLNVSQDIVLAVRPLVANLAHEDASLKPEYQIRRI